MNILIVCSGNVNGNESFDLKFHHPFIHEQVSELKKIGVSFDYFFIKGKGISGYLRNIFYIRSRAKERSFDFIHAHYGLSVFVSVFQRFIPVIATFHGCDVNRPGLNILSSLAAIFTRANIFVSEDLKRKIFIRTSRKNVVIPCGVNISQFFPLEKEMARKKLGLNNSLKYILFSSGKNVLVKNFILAEKSVSPLKGTEILELSGKSREEVNLLMNACDVFLLTSLREGSPQTIKEAMACNCPIVSTDVGDVQKVIEGTDGCFLTSFEPSNVTDKLNSAFDFVLSKNRTSGRNRIKELNLDSESIAKRVSEVYDSAKKNKQTFL